jgi:ATP-binding cassette subfamily B multidrug efflux pump
MTSIIIAHRFDTIRDCDKIVVIDDSRIVESGNYNELINKKGMFYELK